MALFLLNKRFFNRPIKFADQTPNVRVFLFIKLKKVAVIQGTKAMLNFVPDCQSKNLIIFEEKLKVTFLSYSLTAI